MPTARAHAQVANPANATPAASPLYSAANEVVVAGTISEVVTHPASGLPLGVHLMLSTSQGNVDVHLGPYVAKALDFAALAQGAAIQVTGAMAHLAAGDVLLARTVVVGSRTFVVRNQNGLLLRQPPAGGPAAGGRTSRQRGGQS
jgi:hypothetical protein